VNRLLAAVGLMLGLLLLLPAAGAGSAARYDRYLATVKECPGSDNGKLPATTRVAALRCVVNTTRRKAGLPTLRWSDALFRSSNAKLLLIIYYKEISHTPGKRSFDSTFRSQGYCAKHLNRNASTERCAYSEVIAWGERESVPPREAVRLWLGSPPHRRIFLDRRWREYGAQVSDKVIRDYGYGKFASTVWVLQFGRCC
jgi:uncharacterized protein YkwD